MIRFFICEPVIWVNHFGKIKKQVKLKEDRGAPKKNFFWFVPDQPPGGRQSG